MLPALLPLLPVLPVLPPLRVLPPADLVPLLGVPLALFLVVDDFSLSRLFPPWDLLVGMRILRCRLGASGEARESKQIAGHRHHQCGGRAALLARADGLPVLRDHRMPCSSAVISVSRRSLNSAPSSSRSMSDDSAIGISFSSSSRT